jgi:hypothetical protein
MRAPVSGEASAAAGAKRPWYLMAAMCLMWVFGAMSAASGCSNVTYLRGSNELPETIDKLLAESKADSKEAADKPGPAAGLAHPLVRASLVREQARLVATSNVHRRAFPLALAQLMLGLVLVVAAAAAMAGRPGWREIAVQAITANAALAIAAFALLAPVREATTRATATELVDRGAGLDAGLGRDASIGARQRELTASESQVLGVELLLFGLCALALTRGRTKAFFAAADRALGAPGSSTEHPDA